MADAQARAALRMQDERSEACAILQDIRSDERARARDNAGCGGLSYGGLLVAETHLQAQAVSGVRRERLKFEPL